MTTRLFLATSLGALMSATLMANAQNPPGAREQDRGIREELGRPAVTTPAIPKDVERRERVVVPDSTVGQGQPGLKGEPEPPGGRFQDQGLKDEVGPSEGPRR
jgi:hypothetical protein